MQIGAKESPERRRADDVFSLVVSPVLEEVGLEAYRADLDPSPGGISATMLRELVSAELVIADLTGRNPNVFYELGIVHSFARPLICLAEDEGSLPFDTQDERVIEIGPYSSQVGLGFKQVEQIRESLRASLAVVRADGYLPPSPLRDVAGSRSLDELAPDNPVASKLTLIAGRVDEIWQEIRQRRASAWELKAFQSGLLRAGLRHNRSDLTQRGLGVGGSTDPWQSDVLAFLYPSGELEVPWRVPDSETHADAEEPEREAEDPERGRRDDE